MRVLMTIQTPLMRTRVRVTAPVALTAVTPGAGDTRREATRDLAPRGHGGQPRPGVAAALRGPGAFTL